MAKALDNVFKDISEYLIKSEVLYTSKNKKITTNLLTRTGFSKMPADLLQSDYIGSITYENENVKIKGLPFKEVFSFDDTAYNNYMQNLKNNSAAENDLTYDELNYNPNRRYSIENRENGKYSYDELISKPDMQITQLGVVSDEKYKKYKNARNLFAKDMREIARQENNDNNTSSSVYLHNDDTNKDIIVGLKSYNHGAARLDNTYISVSEKLPQILKNAIAVNELTPRENSNGTKVFIGMAENTKNYVFVRMVVENRTQKLDNYDILYAVQKSKINKDEVAKSPRDRLQSNRLNSSSTISISDLLEFVKENKLVTSVLSKDGLKN